MEGGGRRIIVEPRVDTLREDCPVEDLCKFYDVYSDNITFQKGKKYYIWANTVSSLDGKISFLEPGKSEAQLVARHSKLDFRLLNTGWTFSDAVIGTGPCLRCEENCLWTPLFEDLQLFRQNVLKKRKHPLQVLVTHSGDLTKNGSLPTVLTDKEYTVVVFTITDGAATLRNQFTSEGRDMKECNVEIVECEGADVDLKFAMDVLHDRYGCKFIECDGGGKLIGQMIHQKLLDEVRLTFAGLYCGQYTSTGEERTSMFQAQDVYQPETAPLVNYEAVRICFPKTVFVRGTVEYRH